MFSIWISNRTRRLICWGKPLPDIPSWSLAQALSEPISDELPGPIRLAGLSMLRTTLSHGENTSCSNRTTCALPSLQLEETDEGRRKFMIDSRYLHLIGYDR